MQTTIQYVEKELGDLYPNSEIQAFIRIIFEYVCGLDYTGLLLQKDKSLSRTDRRKIEGIVQRLKKFEPIQYVLGETEFFGLKLKVSPDVLIPRPETEELVYWMSKSSWPSNPVFLDVGTGSGCIALALKRRIPNAKIFAADISEQALKIADENAISNDLEVEFIHFDILKWKERSWPFFDGIVSNPPYVREFEKTQMQANVLEYEPKTALFVKDDDPLLFYREIGYLSRKYLKPKGKLYFEINEGLADESIQLLKNMQFKQIEIKKDIHGKNRMLKAVK